MKINIEIDINSEELVKVLNNLFDLEDQAEITVGFGEKIKNIRKQKGLTQKDLGKNIGVTQQSIGKFEKLSKYPKASTVNKIASALGVDPKDLM